MDEQVGAPGWLSGWVSAFGSGHDPGVLGSTPISGSLAGRLLLPLPMFLPLSLCFSWINKIFKKKKKDEQVTEEEHMGRGYSWAKDRAGTGMVCWGSVKLWNWVLRCCSTQDTKAPGGKLWAWLATSICTIEETWSWILPLRSSGSS